MSSVISVSGVRKSFRGCDALRGVDLEIPPGVVFALLGENGTGKTTLIRILTGFLAPDAGSAKVLGMDSQHQSLEIRRAIGYVSDAPALYGWMSPNRIGWFTAAFYPEGFRDRYDNLLKQFDVPQGRPIKLLSKGQRAKVALALAVAHEPELLIMDEPTSGLDPLVRRQFLESMVERAATGRTVLLSSHQIDEVERVADWVAILRNGRIAVARSLTDLKETTKVLQVRLSDPLVEIPDPVKGHVIQRSASGRQKQLVVVDFDPSALEALRSSTGVQQVDVITPTLEEIFVACTRGELPHRQHESGKWTKTQYEEEPTPQGTSWGTD